jgi:metallo-beta-lactamase class B
MRLLKLVALSGLTLTLGFSQNTGPQAKQGKGGGKGGNAFAGIDWNKPFPAHKVIGNVYFVGSEQLGSFLIATPEGNILINSDYEETVPVIRAAIEKLGFKFADTKILLNSHAHPDHTTGDAMIKELTAAKVYAMAEDVPALQNIKPGGKMHPIDQVIHDGDTVSLGGVTLTAHLTPGHTKGCTTWTMKLTDGGKTYDVVIVGSPNVNPGYKLVGNPAYPQIAEDYERMWRVLKSLPCDIFLGAHGSYFGLEEKYPLRKEDGANPFVDPDGYKRFITQKEQDFRAELAKQRVATK